MNTQNLLSKLNNIFFKQEKIKILKLNNLSEKSFIETLVKNKDKLIRLNIANNPDLHFYKTYDLPNTVKAMGLEAFIDFFSKHVMVNLIGDKINYPIENLTTICLKHANRFLGITVLLNKNQFIADNIDNIIHINSLNSNIQDFQIILNWFDF